MRSFVNVRKYTRSQGIVNELSQGWQNKIQALVEQWSRKRIEVANFRIRLFQNGRQVKYPSLEKMGTSQPTGLKYPSLEKMGISQPTGLVSIP